MSRCFPYPPPGYTLSRAREESLIESIKHQEEKQRKREEKEKKKLRKEEKRRKKEEKEKRKERRKDKKEKSNPRLDEPDIVKAYIGLNNCSDKGDSLHQKIEAETEQLERSGLTEEYGNPVRLPVPSSSSDSTEKSNKRKRDSSPIAKGILIRLPSKKQNEFDASASKKQNEFDASAKEQLLCTTSGRTDCPLQNRLESFSCTLKGSNKKNGAKSVNNAVLTPMQRMELQYINLFENLAPPPVQDGCLSPDDLDWLFQDKNQDARAEKRQKLGSDSISCSRSSTFWPRAEYLHEIDAYAMPFTVPY
ncbi:hypothetical protein CDL12_14905 [Handroanthus impetiginosus]|uniref:Uncharacterized protein n=1 Tax=Handroanthus impetiginosus TaxID=429701 RepID=A0A2G9H591_9LAMI|nr:hypothetical protein CDL12_14905 [Handroanthus impetiginosus]